MSGGLNTYGYASNNPVSRVDPLGLSDTTAPDGYVFPVPAVTPWSVGSKENWDISLAIQRGLRKVADAIDELCGGGKKCPPCKFADGTVVPAGTIGYRWDKLPAGKIQHGIAGDHLNLYKANQNPNNCQCFWQPAGRFLLRRFLAGFRYSHL